MPQLISKRIAAAHLTQTETRYATVAFMPTAYYRVKPKERMLVTYTTNPNIFTYAKAIDGTEWSGNDGGSRAGSEQKIDYVAVSNGADLIRWRARNMGTVYRDFTFQIP